MPTPSAASHTIRLHRVLLAPPERVYRAFLDPRAKCKWLPPHGFVAEMHKCDPRVGGSYHMSFINFNTGQAHTFGGTYVELIPNQLVRYTDRFDDPNLPGEMHITITLRSVSCGTDLTIVQEGVPAVIPPESCYAGWQQSLHLLAHIVEPAIP